MQRQLSVDWIIFSYAYLTAEELVESFNPILIDKIRMKSHSLTF